MTAEGTFSLSRFGEIQVEVDAMPIMQVCNVLFHSSHNKLKLFGAIEGTMVV